MSTLTKNSEAGVASEPEAIVRQLMRQRIDHYVATRSDPSLYQSVRNMSQLVSDDYGNRFLIELIQNAHDAHDPARDDGEIEIVLDATDGDFGCLYVANRGTGFTPENLKAITNIALSNKPVNAGIGNKGLGFRSVLQICHWPEVFSVQGEGGRRRFDGFCFRFATTDDLRQQLNADSSDLAEEMAENLPCWHVPVPMAPRLAVERFAKENFATVVRLPFKSQDALTTAQDQIESLRSLETPLHLFLERVRRISIDAGAGSLVRLDRTVRQSVAFAPQGTPEESTIVITRLELGTEPYVVAHRDIADDTFKAALKTSLAKGEVPESWRNWEGRARVSIAVPLRQPLGSGRLYCFLPLGPEGRAPFAGYINANFYTKMDRRAVDTSNHLNDLFLHTAVSIGGCLIEFLATSDWSEAPSAVVSLLCWDGAYLRALQVAMGANGQAILNRPIMPVRGAGGTVRWASPKETYAWTSASDACLSVQRICEVAGGHLLVELLTEGQLDALNRTYAQLRNYGFAPPPVILAGWVEKIAIKMQEERAPPERWAEFYDEVAEALSDRPDALFGRRFLLSVNGELISSDPPEAGSAGRGRRSADVYFAPVLSMDASVEDEVSRRSLPLEELPDTLRKGFALLSRDIPWGDDEVGHRPGRTFLRTGRLVREYDTGAVLRTLAGVTRSGSVDRTREQALEWAFRLWNSSRSLSDKETRSANFFVPSTDGWIEAEAAMFGYGWDVRNAKRLHTLLGLVADLSEELKAARGRILPDFADWPVRHGTHSDWLRFLAAAGVTDCLRPVGGELVTPEPRGNPAALVALIANAVPKMAEPVRAHWLELLTAACRGMYATCPYKAELKPWHFPGQWEAATFPDELRRDYAVQIVYALRAVGEEHRGFRVMRSDYGARVVELRRLPTPLVAHLTGADWMPVMRPGGELHFVRPCEAWLFDSDDERPPGFMDFAVRQLATEIDETTREWLQAHAGLGLFNDERHAERALLAVAHAADGGIQDVRDVRRYQDIFLRMWRNVRRVGTPAAGPCIPVMRAGQIAAVSASNEDIPIAYFDDERDSLRKQLHVEEGHAIFDFVRGDEEAVWEWIQTTVPDRFRKISDELAEILIDGERFDERLPSRFLSDVFGSWLVDFLVCVVEHKGSAFVQATQSTLGRIRRAAMSLRIVAGVDVRIQQGSDHVPLPASLRGALALSRPGGSTLILQTGGNALTLELLAGAAGQLAVALGSRELANGIEASLLRIVATHGQVPDSPGDDALAAALGVERDAITLTRKLASGDLVVMLDLAIPLSACRGTRETTSLLQAVAAAEGPSDQELHRALERLAAELGHTLAEFEERMAGVFDINDLRAEFRIPISKLNDALIQLAGPYKPVSNEVVHREAWGRFLRRRLSEVVERLRGRFAATFDRGDPLTSYALARDGVLGVAPDPAWFITYDELPESVMHELIQQWLTERSPAEEVATPLSVPLGEVRSRNGAQLVKFWTTYAPLLSALVRRQNEAVTPEVRQAWGSPAETRDGFFTRARDSGWLDFRALDDQAIAKWLERAGMWPANKPADPTASAWGLSEESLRSVEDRANADSAARQRRRTQVEFAGASLSALKEDCASIVEAVASHTADAPALKSASGKDKEPSLETMQGARSGGSGGGHSGKGAARSPENSMSDEQKWGVGFIGELWAREWLRVRHQLDVVDESVWVSRYRDLVLNTTGGADSLGYDFLVSTKSRSYYYEVKASTGDPQRFEMGPTEIGAAQRYRADREHRYRILYLANVGDPKRMTATLLPNPFSIATADKFRAIGKGSVVYEFEPSKQMSE